MFARSAAAAITALVLAALAQGPASAATWISGETASDAWAQIDGGRHTLRIACKPNNTGFFFTLSGGPFTGMKNIDDGNDSIMMWIQGPDGRTARHPIDGYYFGPDKTFVGTFRVSDFVLEQFRKGSRLELTAITGQTIAAFPMKGTGKARGHFKQACRI